jgi:hypothetical protein
MVLARFSIASAWRPAIMPGRAETSWNGAGLATREYSVGRPIGFHDGVDSGPWTVIAPARENRRPPLLQPLMGRAIGDEFPRVIGRHNEDQFGTVFGEFGHEDLFGRSQKVQVCRPGPSVGIGLCKTNLDRHFHGPRLVGLNGLAADEHAMARDDALRQGPDVGLTVASAAAKEVHPHEGGMLGPESQAGDRCRGAVSAADEDLCVLWLVEVIAVPILVRPVERIRPAMVSALRSQHPQAARSACR